jgi:hypothetical protein
VGLRIFLSLNKKKKKKYIPLNDILKKKKKLDNCACISYHFSAMQVEFKSFYYSFSLEKIDCSIYG